VDISKSIDQRICMTATPLRNNLAEAVKMVNTIHPGALDMTIFRKKFKSVDQGTAAADSALVEMLRHEIDNYQIYARDPTFPKEYFEHLNVPLSPETETQISKINKTYLMNKNDPEKRRGAAITRDTEFKYAVGNENWKKNKKIQTMLDAIEKGGDIPGIDHWKPASDKPIMIAMRYHKTKQSIADALTSKYGKDSLVIFDSDVGGAKRNKMIQQWQETGKGPRFVLCMRKAWESISLHRYCQHGIMMESADTGAENKQCYGRLCRNNDKWREDFWLHLEDPLPMTWHQSQRVKKKTTVLDAWGGNPAKNIPQDETHEKAVNYMHKETNPEAWENEQGIGVKLANT